MKYLFEHSDLLNTPYEGFIFDPQKAVFPIKPHWHYFMEIIYMIKGTALIDCDNDSYVLNEGDLILFFPQAVHAIYATCNEALTYAVIKFDLNRLSSHSSYAPDLGNIFRTARFQKEAPIYFSSGSLPSLSLEPLFMQIIKEIVAKDYGYDIQVQSLLWTLFIEILRYWRNNGFDIDQAAKNAAGTAESNLLYSITQYIDEHSQESLRVEELARRCHMSYSYFAKSFQRLYGQSCKHYIECIRINKAADYLLFTNFDLSYISQETGFADCSHLIKTFKALKGVTPKQYRLQNIKKDSL